MYDNVFEDNDCVINDKANRRGKATQRHQVERLADQPKEQDGNRDRDWNDNPGY